MPSKQEARLNAARSFNYYYYYYSSRKTERAAQTVRPRNLKLCQLIDQKRRRMYQSLSQIGP